MKAVAILIALAGVAHADLRDTQAGVQLHYELAGEHAVEHSVMEPPSELVLAGVRLHGFVGGRTLAAHLGLDLAAGGTARGGGFAYDVALFPIGGALRFARSSFVTIGVGIGANGATRTLDDAVTFPLELRFELGSGVRVLGRARATWLGAAKARQDGAASTHIADELEAMLGVRLGHAYDDEGFPTGNGYFLGATYRELMGARFAGIVIGYSVDMATSRAPRRPE